MHGTKSQVGQIQMVKSCARDAPFPPVEYLKVSGELTKYHELNMFAKFYKTAALALSF